jgi:hypothetical protein
VISAAACTSATTGTAGGVRDGTRVASLAVMKIPFKLLGFLGLVGGAAAAAVAIDRMRRLPAPAGSAGRMGRMGMAPGRNGMASEGTGMAPDVVIVEAEIIGLADVDPQALTQMGEAIDPELTKAAHEEIPEQRDKLPVRGKNVP